jgi:signal transduction histidine kinase
MKPLTRLRGLPLRARVVLTVVGAAIAALGASAHFSFRYWRGEALDTAEQQALMAAGSTRATLESALRLDRPEPARRSLARLQSQGAISAARVYSDHRILLSSDRYEEGGRELALWIPDARDLPEDGFVRTSADGNSVRAFLPLSVPEPAVLEVEFSVAAIHAAMDRGAQLGIGLMAVSLITVAVIVVTMFEREVVAPLHRMDVLLRDPDRPRVRRRSGSELRELEQSVTRLIEKEHLAVARVADQESLAQVGELAAEMAHEFKRPLASIRTAIEVLQQEYTLDEGGHSMLGAVDGQLEHLHETVHDLFSLAKPIVPETKAVDVQIAVDEALAEARGMPCFERVEVRRVYAPDGILVPGDARRLRQAFLNVATNAAEAMPEGGLLVVEIRSQPETTEVSFSDTGGGLEPGEVEKIMSPFYSTKPLGTGLGLPLVARVIAAHRGGLAIESLPGRGTTVQITLPRMSGVVEGEVR